MLYIVIYYIYYSSHIQKLIFYFSNKNSIPNKLLFHGFFNRLDLLQNITSG